MTDSPAASTPYEILGVTTSVSDDELKRAYRRLLRQTHPDAGGSATEFHAVQLAWERIGTPALRAAYDRSRFTAAEPVSESTFSTGRTGTRRGPSGPRARMHGHPGGWSRQRYLELMREWSGRGRSLDDPYDPELVRSAPREIRHLLAKAGAEEATALLVSGLGIGYTAWHDVDTGGGTDKLDHIVLGPAGLFGIMSEDWGCTVEVRKGELVGQLLAPGEEPIDALQASARSLTKSLRVRFTALVVVVPDGSLSEPTVLPSRGRRPSVVVLTRSRLIGLLRDGMPGLQRGSFEKVFELRSQLQNGIRFVAD